MSGIVCCILDNDSQWGRIFTLNYKKIFFLLLNPLKNLLNMTIISSCFKKVSIKQKHFVCRKILKPFYTNIYFTTLSRFSVYDSIKLIIALCILLLRREMLSMCLLFESNKTICKVNLKLKKNYKLCDSSTSTSSNRSTLYVYVIFFLSDDRGCKGFA